MEGWVLAIIIVVVALVLVVVGILSWWISTSNRLKRMSVKVDESASGIDVALTKRYDLLTKQLGIVKGYAKHEKETLIEVIKARTGSSTYDPKEMSDYNAQLDKLANQINLVVERYPELKANQNFLALQATTADCEEQLQAARRVFNGNVSAFNQDIVSFPTSIVANHLHLQPKTFFQAEEKKREDVKMDF